MTTKTPVRAKYTMFLVALLIFAFNASSLAQPEKVEQPIKSFETLLYSAVVTNGEVQPGNRIETFPRKYPFASELGRFEYDENGNCTKYEFLNIVGKYFYDKHENWIKEVAIAKNLNDSVVTSFTYNDHNHLETVHVSKGVMKESGWLGKRYISTLTDEECFNFYLTNNDEENSKIKAAYKNQGLRIGMSKRLFDQGNRLISEKGKWEEKSSLVNNYSEGYTRTFSRNYEYSETNKVSRLIEVDKFEIGSSGLLASKRGTKKKTTYDYSYNSEGKLTQILETVSSSNVKPTGRTKPKEYTKSYRYVFEYLDDGKKEVEKSYNHKNKLTSEITKIYDDRGKLREKIRLEGKEKAVYKYDEHELLVSYKEYKRDKKTTDYRFEYVLDEHGNPVQRIHFDELNNSPLYYEKRIIEYYNEDELPNS